MWLVFCWGWLPVIMETPSVYTRSKTHITLAIETERRDGGLKERWHNWPTWPMTWMSIWPHKIYVLLIGGYFLLRSYRSNNLNLHSVLFYVGELRALEALGVKTLYSHIIHYLVWFWWRLSETIATWQTQVILAWRTAKYKISQVSMPKAATFDYFYSYRVHLCLQELLAQIL